MLVVTDIWWWVNPIFTQYLLDSRGFSNFFAQQKGHGTIYGPPFEKSTFRRSATFGLQIQGIWDGRPAKIRKHGIQSEGITGSTIRTLLHGKINPKDWQVLSLGDVGFLQFFRVVSGDYGRPLNHQKSQVPKMEESWTL